MVAAVTVLDDGSVEFAYVGEKAWHDMGNELQAGASMEEWGKASGLGNFKINRAPVMFNTGGGLTKVEGKEVLYRSDNRKALGVVSDNYHVMQPRDVLEFFYDIADGYTMETAGTLFDGRRFWALARVQSDEFILDRNDKVGGYLLLSTSADGTLATEARMTTVRVVCNNTLSLARANGKAAFKSKHKSAFDAAKAKNALGINKVEIETSFASAMEDFRRMARQRITTNDQVKMTLELFGYDTNNMTQEEYDAAVRKPLVKGVGTLAVTGRDLIGADMMGGHNTTWGWLNAVTQYVDHVARAKTVSHRLDNSLFGRGNDLKMKAHEIAHIMSGTGQVVTYNAEEGEEEGFDGLLGDVLAATANGN